MTLTENWFDRLVEVLSEKDRSMRAISLAAGKGPNYISQMIKNRKQPSADNLSLILNQFDRDTALYVLTGIKLTQEDLEFLALLSRLPNGVKSHFHAMLLELKETEELEEIDSDFDEREPSEV
jgi:hypothetical protein